jgi:hypothetical protein
MTTIGNHIKTNVHKDLRERVRTFYLEVLQCKPMAAPMADLDLFVFENDFALGVFYVEEADLLTEAEHLKAAWLEIKAKDTEQVKRRLIAFGVKEVDYPDNTARFYFQAPGGQVFRLAAEDGGI